MQRSTNNLTAALIGAVVCVLLSGCVSSVTSQRGHTLQAGQQELLLMKATSVSTGREAAEQHLRAQAPSMQAAWRIGLSERTDFQLVMDPTLILPTVQMTHHVQSAWLGDRVELQLHGKAQRVQRREAFQQHAGVIGVVGACMALPVDAKKSFVATGRYSKSLNRNTGVALGSATDVFGDEVSLSGGISFQDDAYIWTPNFSVVRVLGLGLAQESLYALNLGLKISWL